MPGQVPDVPWEEAALALRHDLDPGRLEARQFILASTLCEAEAGITQYAAESLRPGGLLLESVAELSARIHRDFSYVPRIHQRHHPAVGGRAQPKRPFPPPRDHPITDRPVRRNGTGCKTALNVLSSTR